jgi:hypothetical protein
MAEPRRLEDFPNVSVQDTISVTRSLGADPNAVEFVIETAPNITWWKGLELRVPFGSGELLDVRETQDNNHGPHAFARPADELVGSRLVLSKAKLFGVHTGMYELYNLSAQRGRRLHFLWQRDEDRDGPVAGFFRDVGGGIAATADAVAGVVEDVVGAAAEVVTDVIETVGHGLSDILNVIGDFLGGIPIVGGLLRVVIRWAASVVSAIFDFVGGAIEGLLNLAAGVVAGLIRIIGGAIGGLLAWDGRLLIRGFGDVLSSIVGAVIMILGKLVALIQAISGLQFNERPLKKEERDLLWRVYRGSIAFYNLRIVEGFVGLFSLNRRAFTLGNTMYLKGRSPATDRAALVHECAHVWQNQHQGSRYISDALWAQAGARAYDWVTELARGRDRWRDFNPEAQASFLEDVFRSGRRPPPPNAPGEFYDDDPVGADVEFTFGGTDHASLARESVADVRGKWPWRLSRGLT